MTQLHGQFAEGVFQISPSGERGRQAQKQRILSVLPMKKKKENNTLLIVYSIFQPDVMTER